MPGEKVEKGRSQLKGLYSVWENSERKIALKRAVRAAFKETVGIHI